MKEYYYLISSLYELTVDLGRRVVTFEDFLNLAESQLEAEDFEELKKLFLFNDMKNALRYQNTGFSFTYPAYYDEEVFKENLEDTDSFLPFLAEYFFNQKTQKRLRPDLLPEDELTLLFYENLEQLGGTFLNEFYQFELVLRNMVTALSLREVLGTHHHKLIPWGDYYDPLLKNNTPDFGLGHEFLFLPKLINEFEKKDPIGLEKLIEQVRWDFLDTLTENHPFGIEAIMAYAVKLMSVERWLELNEENGKAMLNKLIEQIKGSIHFPEEFLKVGGKR